MFQRPNSSRLLISFFQKRNSSSIHENSKPYYEQRGNKMNPHTYFYRALAVPFMKFSGVMILTYYGMCGLYTLLDDRIDRPEEIAYKENKEDA